MEQVALHIPQSAPTNERTTPIVQLPSIQIQWPSMQKSQVLLLLVLKKSLPTFIQITPSWRW